MNRRALPLLSICSFLALLSTSAPAASAPPPLPSADSVIGSYNWNVLSDPTGKFDGSDPYSQNCQVTITKSDGLLGHFQKLHISLHDSQNIQQETDVDYSALVKAIPENDQWQRANNKDYDGTYLPVVLGDTDVVGAKNVTFDFYDGKLSTVDIVQVLSTGLFNESSSDIMCTVPAVKQPGSN